jgi:hypothetical protein
MTRLLRMIMLLLSLAAATAAHADKRIALTFDDVPRARGSTFTPDQRAALLVAGLKHAKVRQAAFFVNPGNLASPDGLGGEERISRYVSAGHVIANHGFSHLNLSVVSAQEYLADIDRGRGLVERRNPAEGLGSVFPSSTKGGMTRPSVMPCALGLANRKLGNAYVTVDAADWHIESLVSAAKAAGKTMDPAALRDFYVARHVEAANFNEELARKVLGRSPVHVNAAA